MAKFHISAVNGLLTLVLGAVVAGLDYVVQNSPEYAAYAGFAVAVIMAFLTLENETGQSI